MLDTSILIDAERRGLDVDQMLEALSSDPAEPVALCAMSLMELAHGIVRSPSEARHRQAEGFLADLRAALPVIPVTDEIAVRAGRVDGLLRKSGLTLGVVDVLIAASALEMGYAVATFNVKHFAVVPNLKVVGP